MRTLLTVLLLLLGLYLLYGLLVYWFQKRIIFHPTRLSSNFIFKFDNVSSPCQELWVESHDGERLNALLFKADAPKGLVMLFHGNAGSLESWGMMAERFVDFGYHCLIWDYREFGKTRGNLTYPNMLKDAEAIYQYGKNEFPELPVIPYGVSLGTALATHVGQTYQPDKLVLETPFLTMKQLAKTHFPGLPYDMLLKFRFDNHQALKRFNGQVFIVHGTADRIIPYSHATQLKDSFPEKIHLTTVNGGRHNELEYYEAYRKWFIKALEPASKGEEEQ